MVSWPLSRKDERYGNMEMLHLNVGWSFSNKLDKAVKFDMTVQSYLNLK
jgi:hypothetical protein